MIKQVRLRYFKRFQEETFDISDSIILAGSNNAGKTTLLQAIAVWSLALQKWLTERGLKSGSIASKRTGVAITRKDFTAIPLREMNLLWTNCSTALYKEELKEGQKLGTPRLIEIEVKGKAEKGDWSLKLEFTYRYPDVIHVRPAEETPMEVLEIAKNIQVVHVPSFSGIGAEETRYDKAYQSLLIGQGKPGDILRNLLLEVAREKPEEWKQLCFDIEKMFSYRLLPPIYEGRPFILCEYQPDISNNKGRKGRLPRLDISCAGSGFLQVLMLLGFFYARPASILLLDEPDAHLHVILQKQIYDRLREISRQRGCQVLIATHSEVLVDGTSPEKIISFFQHPHKLEFNTEREQVREALKRLTSLDLLMVEQSSGILYVEGESDVNLLREWARIFEHPASQFFSKNLFWHNNQGRHPREARAHFFALQAVKPNIHGVLILDGDNRQLPDHELLADGLTILRWRRYEAENYLIHPEVLARFVKGATPNLFTMASAEKGLEYLKNQLPPAVYENPLVEHDYLNVTPASKTLLPGFFKAADLPLTKNEYYQVAAQMLPEEIPNEVKDKCNVIYEILKETDLKEE
ncbi:MAG: AAA family ATPase [Nitrospirota bacterium]